jgi:hypothetical protein
MALQDPFDATKMVSHPTVADMLKAREAEDQARIQKAQMESIKQRLLRKEDAKALADAQDEKLVPCRQTGQSILRQRIMALRLEADQLEALLGLLPVEEGPAEEAVFKLLRGSSLSRNV